MVTSTLRLSLTSLEICFVLRTPYHVLGAADQCQQVPNPEAHLQYKQLLERYRAVYPALKPLFHGKVREFFVFFCGLRLVYHVSNFPVPVFRFAEQRSQRCTQR